MKTAAALLLSLIATTAIAHPDHDLDEPSVPTKVEADAKAKVEARQADAAAKAAAEKAKVDAEAAKAAAAKGVKKP